MVPGRFKDFISTPKRNGYKSVHTTIMFAKNMRVEVQIRSAEMHRASEHGFAAHWAYKDGNKKANVKDIKQYRWLRELLDILEQEQRPEDFLENPETSSFGQESSKQLERMELSTILEKEIEKLPNRQREAFLMRYWEELDISETASAMGCSEGSVKTHCSRACHTLALALKKLGISF